MIFEIPVQFNARPYKGTVRKREIRNIPVEAETPLQAMQLARDHAANRIGTRIANCLCQVFTVWSVEVRSDLFHVPYQPSPSGVAPEQEARARSKTAARD